MANSKIHLAKHRFFISESGKKNQMHCDLAQSPLIIPAYQDTKIIPIPADGWMPVEVELPSQEDAQKHYERYGEHPQYIVMIAHAVTPAVLSFDGTDFYDSDTNEQYRVTHWMGLPAPPSDVSVRPAAPLYKNAPGWFRHCAAMLWKRYADSKGVERSIYGEVLDLLGASVNGEEGM